MKSILISAGASLLLLLSSMPAQAAVQPIENLTQNDKKAIAEYVFSVMDAYVKGKDIPDAPLGKKLSAEFEYNYIFISLYSKHVLMGCQAGLAGKGHEGRLLKDLKDAAIKCIRDERFDAAGDKRLNDDSYIVVSFLHGRKDLECNDLDYLKENIALGVHSMSIHRGDSRAYFISSVPVTKSYSLKNTLVQLCKKAGLESNCYVQNDTEIRRYNTLVFKADRKNNITDLYRYNLLVAVDDVRQESILESLMLAKDWFLNNVNPETGLLEYMYYPAKDTYDTKNNNHTRQLATLWALTELKGFLKTNELDVLIKKTFGYYLPHQRVIQDYAYVDVDKNPSIALNAFMIMALLNTEVPDKSQMLERLAKGILRFQKSNGSYRTHFLSKKTTGEDYFPGEAMLALMKLYDASMNRAYLESVKKAFSYYRKYWRKNRNTAFIPWHSQAYYLLYQAAKDPAYADFVFEMNDWLIENYQKCESLYPDEIGGFPRKTPSGCSTAVYLEGLNCAYALAKDRGDHAREEKYMRSIMLGARFILQAQCTAVNCFYFKNPQRAIGGIKGTLVDSRQRVDYIQHTVMAFLKTYKNAIFEETAY